MKVNAINNNQINSQKAVFKGYNADPGLYARTAGLSDEQVKEFVKSMEGASERDVITVGLFTAFGNKLKESSEIIGGNGFFSKLLNILHSDDHQKRVKAVDESITKLSKLNIQAQTWMQLKL